VKGFKINKNNDNKEEKKDREREEDGGEDRDRDDVDDFFTLKESMVELNELCKTAGFRTVGYLTQILQQKNPRTCIGSGKVYENKPHHSLYICIYIHTNINFKIFLFFFSSLSLSRTHTHSIIV
jgi:50S ribosomal subunit-associated GTPase HflX